MIALVADVHIGNSKVFPGFFSRGLNARCWEKLGVLRAAVKRAQELGVEKFLIAGDLMDTVNPDPRMVAAVQDAFDDMDVAILLGNHEMVSTATDDHSLAPLKPVADVFDFPASRVYGDVEVLYVPYQPGASGTWLAESLVRAIASRAQGEHADSCSAVRVLVLHLGISDMGDSYWLDGSDDSVRVEVVEAHARANNIDYVIAGNWHRKKFWDRGDVKILQVGALVPTGFNNPGLEGFGGMAIIDKDGLRVEEIPGPRFVKVTGDQEFKLLLEKQGSPSNLYVHVDVPDRAEYEKAITRIGLNRSTGNIEGGRARIVEAADHHELIGDAVQAAAEAGNYIEAVRSYCAGYAFPLMVDREELAAMSIRYLMAQDADDVREALRRESMRARAE